MKKLAQALMYSPSQMYALNYKAFTLDLFCKSV